MCFSQSVALSTSGRFRSRQFTNGQRAADERRRASIFPWFSHLGRHERLRRRHPLPRIQLRFSANVVGHRRSRFAVHATQRVGATETQSRRRLFRVQLPPRYWMIPLLQCNQLVLLFQYVIILNQRHHVMYCGARSEHRVTFYVVSVVTSSATFPAPNAPKPAWMNAVSFAGKFLGFIKEIYENAKSNSLVLNRSASYDSNQSECHLSSEDKFTQPQAFQTNPIYEYIENQCSPPGKFHFRSKYRYGNDSE